MWREIRFFPIQWRDKGKFENFPNSVMEYWQRIVEKLPEITAFYKQSWGLLSDRSWSETKNLQSLIIPNYSIFTSKVGSQNDKVRIIALVHEDLDVIVKDNLMNEKVQTIWLKLTKDTLKKHYCWWNISPMEQTRCFWW